MQHITKPNSKAFCFLYATKLGGAKKNPASSARGRHHLDGRTPRTLKTTIGRGALWQTCEVEIKTN